MAISYDDWKKQYEGMTTEQQKNYASMVKWNATAEAYAKQYIQEKQNAGTFGNQTATSYTNANQSTNTSSSNNYSSNSNNQNGTNWGNTQQPDYFSDQHITDNSEEAKAARARGLQNMQNQQNQWGSPLSDWKNGNGWTYWKFTFDADEYLDTNKFWKSNWEITVKEWTAAQTGRPDYEIETKERLTEMVNNLNTYWDSNPEFFNDRETFNRVFEYNTRQSQAQRDLLDSYWKKAQDYKKASSYNNSASFTSDLDSWNVSESEFEALKKYNQDVYIQWQKEMQDKLNAAIANLANPFSIDDMTTALNKIVEKFDLQAWDPYDIIWGWNQMMEKTWAWDSMKQAQQHFTAADNAIAQIKRIQTNYSSSTGGNQSDALVAARLQKALLPYETLLSNELSAWQHWQNLYQTQLGTANNYASTIQMQAQEDQRIFNNKIKALWFAMDAYSYRTPEQQAQLNLQVSQIQSDLSLLNQSKANDLALYNQYATARMQNQLNYDMTDLNVTDEKQLRTNLKNVLDQYYDAYWAMIQRPEQQVIDDVIALSKREWISIGEALKKNFIEQLQGKPQYQALLNKATWYDPYANQESWTYSVDADWNETYSIKWYWQLPSSLSRGDKRKIYSDIYKQSWNDAAWWALWLSTWLEDWSSTWWCWEFVNDWLISLGEQWIFWDSLESKTKRATESEPVVWSIFVMDSPTRWENWHVGIVTGINKDWTLEVVDSNWTWNKTKQSHTLDPNKYNIYWYYYPKAVKIQNTWYYDPTLTDFYKSDSSKFSSTQWKAINNAGYSEQEYNAMKQNYAAEIWKKITNNENMVLASLYKLRNMSKTWYTAYQRGAWNIPWTDAANYKSRYNTFKSSTALQNLVDLKQAWATFWALSDNELNFIENSSTLLSDDQTYEEFMRNLRNTIADIESWIKLRWGKIDITANWTWTDNYTQILFPDVQVWAWSWVWTWLSTQWSFIINWQP